MSCSKPAPWETSFPYTSGGERCALSWFGPVGSTVLFYIFYLFIFVNCMTFLISFPDCQAAQCQGSPSHLETLREQELKLLFAGAQFHAAWEAAARRWAGRPRLWGMKCDGPQTFIDMWQRAGKSSWCGIFLIPCPRGGSLTQYFPLEVIHIY